MKMKNIVEYKNVSPEYFIDKIKGDACPAVLRGVAAQWPSVALEPHVVMDQLAETASGLPIAHFSLDPAHHGRFFYADGYTSFNYQQEQASITDFFARLRHEASQTAPAALFAGSLALPAYFPTFADVEAINRFIPASDFLQSMWIGNQTLTAPHYDNMENIACVVAGRRRFTLFPIEQFPNLYVGPLDLTPAGQPISLVDIRAPDYERFPRYREAEAHGMSAILEPGDAIYIPAMWWHGVESLDPFNVMVNTWWRDVPSYFGSPMQAVYHALLALRDLPPAQRDAWKHVFDNLVFETHGPALEHLPPAARGMFGDLTRSNAAHIRQFLAQSPM
jgi:hypothetical protein